MASVKFSLVLLLPCILSLQGVLADIVCENLPTNVCAFSISSSGKRCVIEDTIMSDGKVEYQCKTSEVVVGSSTSEYLESDECVKACGVDRKSVGMSSDAFLDPSFAAKLCSSACYDKCPNLIDLYSNLAAGEGVYLPDLCEKERSRRSMVESESEDALAPTGSRRGMTELQSDGAPAPTGSRRGMTELSDDDALAPAADAPTADAPLY